MSMRFDIITIFPEAVEAYFNESILRCAREKKLIDIKIWNLRDFTKDKHRKTDDRVFGGGPGMVMKIEPLVKAFKRVLSDRVAKSAKLVVLLDADGSQFNSAMATRMAKKYKHIVFICGRYEGIDDRLKKIIIENWKLKTENLSAGPYVLTGGELPAMVIADAVPRHIPGVLGKSESLEEKRYGVGVPVYTRPEIFKYKGKKYSVPKVLLSGNHKKIAAWRQKRANLR